MNVQNRAPTIDSAVLSEEAIEQALRIVEIALRRANGDEAKAAIDRAISTLEPEFPVTRESPVIDLGLGVRTTVALEGQLCFTVGDVCLKSYTDLRRICNFGDHTINQIRVALSKYGFRLYDGTIMASIRTGA